MHHWQSAQLALTVEQVREQNNGTLWVAAYGSLPNRPEPGMGQFEPALVIGYEKALCVRVNTCRGRLEAAGYVAGLLPSLDTSALAALAAVSPKALMRLDRRELDGKAYDPRPVTVQLSTGEKRMALSFVAAITHPDCKLLDTEVLAPIVREASGSCGTNRAYLDGVLRFERETFGKTSLRLLALENAINNIEETMGRQLCRACRDYTSVEALVGVTTTSVCNMRHRSGALSKRKRRRLS